MIQATQNVTSPSEIEPTSGGTTRVLSWNLPALRNRECTRDATSPPVDRHELSRFVGLGAHRRGICRSSTWPSSPPVYQANTLV